jgi:hypothetical protein
MMYNGTDLCKQKKHLNLGPFLMVLNAIAANTDPRVQMYQCLSCANPTFTIHVNGQLRKLGFP